MRPRHGRLPNAGAITNRSCVGYGGMDSVLATIADASHRRPEDVILTGTDALRDDEPIVDQARIGHAARRVTSAMRRPRATRSVLVRTCHASCDHIDPPAFSAGSQRSRQWPTNSHYLPFRTPTMHWRR